MKRFQYTFESQLPSFGTSSAALESDDYDDTMTSRDYTLCSLESRFSEHMDTLQCTGGHGAEHGNETNFIGAYDVSAITYATEMETSEHTVEPKTSSMVLDELPTMMLEECFNIWDIPRLEPEGLESLDDTTASPLRMDIADESHDELVQCSRDDYMNITMYSDEDSSVHIVIFM